MKLAIISHTEHYFDKQGGITGWGATVREINYLTQLFEKIYHIAPLHPEMAPSSAIPYATNEELGIKEGESGLSNVNIIKNSEGSIAKFTINNKLDFVPLHVTGGERLADKINVLLKAPSNLLTVSKILDKVDVFQFRAPAGIGVYMIPWLKLTSKPGWFKYAGNWVHENPPLGYRVQRFLLTRFSGNVVTINGRWPGQRNHCLTFENPCLSDEEIVSGKKNLDEKGYDGKLEFAFVGRLEDAKGVGRILEAFSRLKDFSRIGTVHFVGDGPKREEYAHKAQEIPVDFVFHGFLSREKVGLLLGKCHVFLLPSESEGFPKVVAEAANYGCVPLVSDVSSVGQYIRTGDNGFVFSHKNLSGDALYEQLKNLLEYGSLKDVAVRANQISEKFSFSHYLERIKNDVLPVLK